MRKLAFILGLLLWPSLAVASAPTKIEWHGIPVFGAGTGGTNPSKVQVHFPNPAAAGDTLLIGCTYGSASNVISTITDNIGGNTWIQDKTQSDGTNGQSGVIIRASNVAANTRVVTINFTGATGFAECAGILLNNFATSAPVDVSCGSSTATGTTLSCSAMTTTQAADEVVMCAISDGTLPGLASFTAGSGFTLFYPDAFSPMVCEFGNVAQGAVTPSIASSVSITNAITVGVAYKTVASSGGSPGTGIYAQIAESLNFSEQIALSSATVTVNFPCPSGSGINLIDIGYHLSNITSLNSVSSTNPTQSFTLTTTSASGSIITGHAYFVNGSCGPTTTITFTLSATPDATHFFTCTIWGISGAATSPLDTTVGATGNLAATSGTVSAAPTITTATANELITFFSQETGETVTSVTSATGTMRDGETDFGVYSNAAGFQDGGVGILYAATATAYNISIVFSNYEGATNVGPWSSQAMAWKAPAAGATIVPRHKTVIF
jgi:hypothetical protein